MAGELADFIAQTALSTEACLEKLLQPASGFQVRLLEAMRYSIFAGGKRLRPALFMATLEAFSTGLEAEQEAYLPFAAALEMIHTYSLIHDDLPAMDDDDLRRGRPTCHKAFDEATAILAGDALLTQAFAVMASIKNRVSPLRLINALEEVAFCAGSNGMIAGQMADIALTGQQAASKQLYDMIQQKTGALFRASTLCAAYLAGAGQAKLNALSVFAQQLGITFQIVDDILDITGNQTKLGKPIGSDAKNSKINFATLLGQDEARKIAQRAAHEAKEALKPLGDNAILLCQFPALMLNREK